MERRKKQKKINVLLSLEELRQCQKYCDVNIQTLKSKLLSHPCKPLLGCPAPAPAPGPWPQQDPEDRPSQSESSAAPSTSSLTSVHPALKQAFVCRSTVPAPQGRNQQSLIRDSLPSVLPPTHLHNGPFPRQYPSSLPLCWPRRLELSLQSLQTCTGNGKSMLVPTDALAVDSKAHRVPAPWGTEGTDGLGWLGRERGLTPMDVLPG